jgi:adenylate cyclase class 2
MLTYKGEKLPGKVKARRELEWRLDPGDSDGSKMEELLGLLSFRQVAVVKKQRRTFALQNELADFTVVIDSVTGLGDFAEIELVVREKSEVERARDRIESLASQLGLLRVEPRSYLRMILEQNSN